MLNPELRERLWPFLGGIAKQNGITPRCIGGVADHVHLLLSLPTTVPIAKAIQLVKAGSSAWIHQTFRQLDNFSWQQGYGAFSVSVSQLPETIHSIHNQVEHHRTELFNRNTWRFCSGMSSVSTTTICGTDNDFDRPSRRGRSASLPRHFVPGCLATINLSLRDKSHSPIEAPHNDLSAYGR